MSSPINDVPLPTPAVDQPGSGDTAAVPPPAAPLRGADVARSPLPCWLGTAVALSIVLFVGCATCLLVAVTVAPQRITIIQHHGSLAALLDVVPFEQGRRAFAQLVGGGGGSFLEPTPLSPWGAAGSATRGGQAPSTALHLSPGAVDGTLRGCWGKSVACLEDLPHWVLTLAAWLSPLAVMLLLAACAMTFSRDKTPATPGRDKSAAPRTVAVKAVAQPLTNLAESSTEIRKSDVPRLWAEDDIDILEAFDDLDRGRQGFVHCKTVRDLLGSSTTESDVIRAVAAMTPSYGVLFYPDFVRLAQRPGPLANVLAERGNRRQRHYERAKRPDPAPPEQGEPAPAAI